MIVEVVASGGRWAGETGTGAAGRAVGQARGAAGQARARPDRHGRSEGYLVGARRSCTEPSAKRISLLGCGRWRFW